VLPDRVVNQIAAGEVIERPAAVVKELIENSLDAGATRIEVEFRHGGKSYIRVEDNGGGMTPDDALLALERHATSKLQEADDLLRITSLGFRGEALPSIASVSRFTLKTRAASWDHGAEIFVNGGKLIHQRECGMPVGTRIEVAHLFNSVPARRKFLKTDNTEAAHIIHLVRLLAVARPGAAFTLLEDGRTVFRSPECPTMADRVGEIWGRQLASQLVELPEAAGDQDLRLRGLVGKPGVGRSTRREMIALVNGRAVDSRTLNYALIEAYHTFIPKGRYPVAFLFLNLPPAAVDVNIHPAKREIRFRDEPAVRRFVLTEVQRRLRALSQGAPAPKVVPEEPPDDAARQARAVIDRRESSPAPPPKSPAPAIRPAAQETPPANAYPRTSPQPVSDAFRKRYLSDPEPTKTNHPPAPAPAGPSRQRAATATAPAREEPNAQGAAPAKPWRLIGRVKVDFALFETEAGLTILRLRAAHERIWFERIVKDFASQSHARQQLLLPLPLEFEPRAAAAVQEHHQWLNDSGFTLDEFGRNFYRLEAHPEWLPENQAETFLRDLIDRLREGEIDPAQSHLAHEQLAQLAATRAVRYDDNPPDAAIERLAHQLLQCQQPLACPRGRPTIVELSANELRKRFGL